MQQQNTENTTDNVAQIYIEEGMDMEETDPSSLSLDNRTQQSQEPVDDYRSANYKQNNFLIVK